MNKLDQVFIKSSERELFAREQFKNLALAQTENVLNSVGIEYLPPILFVLSDNGVSFLTESLKVDARFIEQLLHGFDYNVLAYAYVHKVFEFKKSSEEMRSLLRGGIELEDIQGTTPKIAMCHEDMIRNCVYTYRIGHDLLQGRFFIDRNPVSATMEAGHPASVDLGKNYAIN